MDKITGKIVDSGCGSGRTSRYLAQLGYTVTGIDISLNSIMKAKNKFNPEGVTFLHDDVCELIGFDNHFDTIIDIGCFQSIMSDED